MRSLLFIMLILGSLVCLGQNDATRKKNFNLTEGVAIQGYDPVCYFSQGKAVKGDKNLAAVYEGVTYYFSTVANKEVFNRAPGNYEPQYGGWCAYAMGKNGTKVEVDPATFKIIDGKLFLFYNQFFNNTLKSWNKDESNLHRNADANWKKIIH